MSDLAVRHWLLGLIAAFYTSGKTREAREVACFAADHGIWVRPDQRPLYFVPGLIAKPVHDASTFAIARYFDQSGSTIRDEVLSGGGQAGDGLLPMEEALVDRGTWNVLSFYEDGVRNADACARFPRTAKLIDTAPVDLSRAGVVALSWLSPGTHILPHCGLTNARLRLHYPLSVDDGAQMRVGDSMIRWELGRTVVFDDSFEHEIWHDGKKPRLVLLADFFHPELSEAEGNRLAATFYADANLKISKFLRGAGLRSLSIGGMEFFNVEFEGEQNKRIRRLMASIGAEAVRVSEDGKIAIDRFNRPIDE